MTDSEIDETRNRFLDLAEKNSKRAEDSQKWTLATFFTVNAGGLLLCFNAELLKSKDLHLAVLFFFIGLVAILIFEQIRFSNIVYAHYYFRVSARKSRIRNFLINPRTPAFPEMTPPNRTLAAKLALSLKWVSFASFLAGSAVVGSSLK